MKPCVKGLRRRRDGWTPERQHAVLAAVEETGSISRAVASVGLSRASFYKLLRQPDAAAFDAAFRAAYASYKARALAAAAQPIRYTDGTHRSIVAGPVGAGRFQAAHWLEAPEAPRNLVNFRPSGEVGCDRAGGAILSTSKGSLLAPAVDVP